MGFILVALGFTVGLGKIWRFPTRGGEQGGSFFLLFAVHLVFIAASVAIIMA